MKNDEGGLPVQALEGKTRVEGEAYVEPERLSYQSAELAAAAIAKAAGCLKGKTVIVTGTKLLADFATLEGVRLQLGELRRTYESLGSVARASVERSIPRAADRLGRTGVRAEVSAPSDVGPAAVGAIGLAVVPVVVSTIAAGLQATLGLASLFREDVDYREVRTVVDPLAFALALAGQLRAREAKEVLVPELAILPSESGDGSLTSSLVAAHQARLSVWSSLGPVISELVQRESELERAVAEKDQQRIDDLTARTSDLRRELGPMTSPLERADRRFDELQSVLARVDESTGISGWARLLRAESFKAKAGAANTIFLHAAIVSSGGHHRISRSLWRTMFVGDGLSFMGSTVARWAVLDARGAVLSGGLVQFRADSPSKRRWCVDDV